MCSGERRRPYAWSNTVQTVDGRISFSEPDAMNGPTISLRELRPEGARIDWRLVQAGWALADAVLASPMNLRDEPLMCFVPTDPELRRIQADIAATRGRGEAGPLHVILTYSGEIPLEHRVFHETGYRTLVATSDSGAATIAANVGALKSVEHTESFRNGRTRVLRLQAEDASRTCHLDELMELLYSEYGIRTMDVTCGSRVISQLIRGGLLNELRCTIAGQIAGAGRDTDRPLMFPNDVRGHGFSHRDSPLLEFIGIRLVPPSHLFLRSKIQYRHLASRGSGGEG